jgi:uncharacterized membrane protein
MDVVSSKPTPDSVVCDRCGVAMPSGAAFCPGCGRSMRPLAPAERIAATVGYLTLLPAAVLLFLPAFRHSRFVRFHAWQSVFLWGIFLVLTMASLALSNMAAAIVFLLFGILASLAMFFLWAVLSFKAWQGERFELPVFGRLAARLS